VSVVNGPDTKGRTEKSLLLVKTDFCISHYSAYEQAQASGENRLLH